MGHGSSPSAAGYLRASALLGLTPHTPEAPAHEFTARDEVVDGVRVRELSLHPRNADSIPALLLTPATGHGSWPGAVAIHQHNNEYHWGKSEPAGLAGDARLAYGHALAARGVAVIVPDLHGFEDRRSNCGDDREFELFTSFGLISEGSSRAAQHIGDLREAISWLSSCPDVAPSIGLVGHSLGGTLAFFTAAVDDRVSAIVSNGGIGPISSFMNAGRLHNPTWYVPGLARNGDAQALAATYSCPVWLSSGDQDDWFPVAGVQEVAAAFPQGTVVRNIFHGGHEFPEDVSVHGLDWLATELLERS